MANQAVFAGMKAEVAIAAACTLLAWWLFSLVTPEAKLGVMETAVVFLAFYALVRGVAYLRGRLRKPSKSHEDAG